MTANDDGRPGQGRPSESPAGSGTTSMLARHTDNPLRRRRAAALRCPPLADGFRDPLDRAAPHWTEDRVRELANTLAAQGFSVEYIAHRYGIRPRPKSTQHCPCCRHHQEAA